MAMVNTKLEDIFNVGSSTYGIGVDGPPLTESSTAGVITTHETIDSIVNETTDLDGANRLEKMISDYEESHQYIHRDKIDSALPEVLEDTTASQDEHNQASRLLLPVIDEGIDRQNSRLHDTED